MFGEVIKYKKSKLSGGSVIMLVRGDDGRTYLPLIKAPWKREFEEFGGKVDMCETGEECAWREFAEEGSDLVTNLGIDKVYYLDKVKLEMKIGISKDKFWTVVVVLVEKILPTVHLSVASELKFLDTKYLNKGSVVSCKFFSVDDIYGPGRKRRDFNDEWFCLSGRTRRILSDRRIRSMIENCAKNHYSYPVDESNAIILDRPTPPLENRLEC
jgi:hypothetical protein